MRLRDRTWEELFCIFIAIPIMAACLYYIADGCRDAIQRKLNKPIMPIEQIEDREPLEMILPYPEELPELLELEC